MDNATSMNIEDINKKLIKYDITYDHEKFSPNFVKICIKTDWESTIYEARFGRFRTILNVISIKV